jgi:hypothetical protein
MFQASWVGKCATFGFYFSSPVDGGNLEVGSTLEYSKFHSIPFQVFPVELEWNLP